ncbi:MAG: PD40 domain-containing protein [Planctomycetes bacterium]|nr:PD40 domain-containing protein [Planctomycetota bacterium]
MGGSKDNKKRQPVVAGVPGKIAFSSNRGGQYEVYTINADGSTVRQVTKKGGFKDSVVWAPDGQKIAYTSHSMSEDAEVYVINADGTGLVQLTDNDSEDEEPVWSPAYAEALAGRSDGRRIAFKSASIAERKQYEDGAVSISHNRPEIFTVNADGSGLKQLTSDAAVADSQLAWSPDGNEIAFVTLKNNDWNIYLVDVNNGNQRKLTSGHWDFHPAWSSACAEASVGRPDGQMVAFTSRADFGAPTGLAIINSDGSGQKILTSEKVLQKPVRWSPDGSRLLYMTESAGPFSDDICVINADGSGLKRLTNTKQQEEDASWSPDGQLVCFTRDFELYIIRADGSGEEHKISDERGSYGHATWSPTK